jgi:hypothetical protein
MDGNATDRQRAELVLARVCGLAVMGCCAAEGRLWRPGGAGGMAACVRAACAACSNPAAAAAAVPCR